MNQTTIASSKSDQTFRAIWWSGFIDGFIALPILGLVIGYLAVQAGGLPAVGRWFVQTNELHKAEAIIVLAGGGPERLCHGIELYKRGLAPAIYYTGDQPLEARSDLMDAEQALGLAERRGVPRDKITLLPSTSTFEDGQAISKLVKDRKIKALILVTSWYHSRRALKVIRHCVAGQEVALCMSCSTNLTYTPDNWWQNEEGLVAINNEAIKTALYWKRYAITPW